MNKRGTGVVFCLIAALLFIAKHITTALYMIGLSTASSALSRAAMNYKGTALLVFSVISLIVGIAYIVWAEYEAYQDRL